MSCHVWFYNKMFKQFRKFYFPGSFRTKLLEIHMWSMNLTWLSFEMCHLLVYWVLLVSYFILYYIKYQYANRLPIILLWLNLKGQTKVLSTMMYILLQSYDRWQHKFVIFVWLSPCSLCGATSSYHAHKPNKLFLVLPRLN